MPKNSRPWFWIAVLTAVITLFAGYLYAAPAKPAPAATTPAPLPTCPARPCTFAGGLVGEVTSETPKKVAGLLAAATAAAADDILIVIDSPGGHSGASTQVFRLLRDSSIPVTCVVPRMAASGAFLILQGCKTRLALPEAKLMVHGAAVVLALPPGATLVLTRPELRALLAELDVETAATLAPVARRIGMALDALLARVEHGDWEMGSGEALRHNIIDDVVDSLQDVPARLAARHRPAATK